MLVYMCFLSWQLCSFAWNPLGFKDRKRDWHYLLPDPWEDLKSRWLWRKWHKNTKQEFQGSLWNSCEDAVIKRKKFIIRTKVFKSTSPAVTQVCKLFPHIGAPMKAMQWFMHLWFFKNKSHFTTLRIWEQYSRLYVVRVEVLWSSWPATTLVELFF